MAKFSTGPKKGPNLKKKAKDRQSKMLDEMTYPGDKKDEEEDEKFPKAIAPTKVSGSN